MWYSVFARFIWDLKDGLCVCLSARAFVFCADWQLSGFFVPVVSGIIVSLLLSLLKERSSIGNTSICYGWRNVFRCVMNSKYLSRNFRRQSYLMANQQKS